MLDLALDTSSSVGSIALGNEKVVVQSIELKGPQRHSAVLFPALTRLGIPPAEAAPHPGRPRAGLLFGHPRQPGGGAGDRAGPERAGPGDLQRLVDRLAA